MSRRHSFFECQYDGITYRQTHRLDPRLLIPGIMVTVLSVPLILWTWPAPMTFGVSAVGLALVVISFAKRHHFSVSRDGYCISWTLGPMRWSTKAASDKATPELSRGRAPYQVVLKCSGRTLDPLIQAATREEGDAWLAFLADVSHGVRSMVPKE